VVQRGYKQPPAYTDAKVLQAPVGHYFDVMTNGYGAMPDYAAQVSAPDRWRIAAYIRALQLSQRATLADVPADKRNQLAEPPPTNMQLGNTLPEQVEHPAERGQAK
jgi:mono/diheme cytochrome c family protein